MKARILSAVFLCLSPTGGAQIPPPVISLVFFQVRIQGRVIELD